LQDIRNLRISRAAHKSQAHQGTSLFTSEYYTNSNTSPWITYQNA